MKADREARQRSDAANKNSLYENCFAKAMLFPASQ